MMMDFGLSYYHLCLLIYGTIDLLSYLGYKLQASWLPIHNQLVIYCRKMYYAQLRCIHNMVDVWHASIIQFLFHSKPFERYMYWIVDQSVCWIRSLLPTWSVPGCCNSYHGIVLQMTCARTKSLVVGFAPPWSAYSSLPRRVSLPDCTASFWDLARQFVEQDVTNGPNPLFFEYYAVD